MAASYFLSQRDIEIECFEALGVDVRCITKPACVFFERLSCQPQKMRKYI